MRTQIIIGSIVSAVSVLQPGQAIADWSCTPTWKGVCGERGCEAVSPVGDVIRVQRENGTYQLCTVKTGKCDAYRIDEIEPAGAFEIIRFNGANYLKVATTSVELLGLEEGAFLEVRHGMLSAISSGGRCTKE
jgi:hypothetical protein